MLLNCGIGEDSWESLGLQGDWSWVFFGRNDAKAETPVLWPPHAKSWLIWKDPDAGRGWGQEEKGMTEDKMAGWHHRLNGHEFEWTLGVGDGQEGLACCDSWGRKKSDTTENLNWTDDPDNALLGIHTEETRIERDTCTPVFIAALFIIARTWKQPRCPSADEWIRKLWYIYTMEYYSAVKKNSSETVLMRWMKLEPIIQSEVSQKEKHQYSILTHIYGI